MNFVPQWESEPKWHAKLHFLPLFEDPSIVCPIRPSGPVTSGASVVCLNNFSKIFQKRIFFKFITGSYVGTSGGNLFKKWLPSDYD